MRFFIAQLRSPDDIGMYDPEPARRLVAASPDVVEMTK
jgi:hypothetical protein